MRNLPFQPANKEKAVALVIVLAVIVLVAGAVVAFFSQATSSRQVEASGAYRQQADILAQSAGNYVIGQFLQEITANSAATTTGSTTIYFPNSNNDIIPKRQLGGVATSDTNFFTLVRQSSADPNASGDSTTTVARNGQFIAPSRWSKPALAGTAATFTAAQAPNWVYMSATAGPGSSMSSRTIGRFAYNVYNIGGLLNANIAGYSSALGLSAAQIAQLKGPTAGADLTKLGINQATVDALVNFRKDPAIASAATYVDFVTAAAANGFLDPKVTGNAGNYTSNYFTTRQDLLRYVNQQNTGLAAALPYLTTFSQATNAPTWKPSTPSGSTTDYAAIKDATTSANRDVLGVRCSGSATFTHYDDNGNRADYPVKAGDPLIQRRFSLAKLSWITHNGPGTGTSGATISAQAISASFGLTWNPNAPGPGSSFGGYSPRWEYNALSADGRIKRLDEVAAENREPNFFELLKAGILWNSLGRDPGPAEGYIMNNSSQSSTYNGAVTWSGVVGFNFQNWSGYKDMQVLQIGVNLIDQVTPGNYPNAIYSQIIPTGGISDPYALADLQILQTVYGTKDIPYLYGIQELYYYVDAPTSNGQKHLGTWLQPSIWNPHAQSTVPGPTEFRTNTYGSAYFIWNYLGSAATSGTVSLPASGSSSYINVTGTGSTYRPIIGPALTVDGPLKSNVKDTNGIWKNLQYQPAPGGWDNPYKGPQMDFTGGANGQIYFPASTGSMARIQPVLLTGGTAGKGNITSAPAYWEINPAYNSYIDPVTTKDLFDPPPVGVFFPPACSPFITGTTDDPAPYVYNGETVTGTAMLTAGSTLTAIKGKRYTKCLWGGLGVSTKTLTFTLEYKDPIDNTWRPYSHCSKMTGYGGGDMLHANSTPPNPPWNTPFYASPNSDHKLDPRTDRFSASKGLGLANASALNSGTSARLNLSAFPGGTYLHDLFNPSPPQTALWSNYWPREATGGNVACGNPGGFTYVNTSSWFGRYIHDLFKNISSGGAYYSDPDGVIRPADGALSSGSDGTPIYNGNDPIISSGNNLTAARRPVVLNRPFRSVAEMGYAFRDQPFASLNFSPPRLSGDTDVVAAGRSGDLGLLDLFCVNESGTTTAGAININSAPLPVLQALLSQTPVDDAVGGASSLSAPDNIASDLVTLTGAAPLLNRADLAYPLSNSMQNRGSVRESANKNCREAPLRALVSSADTRTWNLLIDVVAQAGRVPNGVAAPAATDFIVEGEKRYWLQVAIDRYTGKIMDQKLEPVDE